MMLIAWQAWQAFNNPGSRTRAHARPQARANMFRELQERDQAMDTAGRHGPDRFIPMSAVTVSPVTSGSWQEVNEVDTANASTDQQTVNTPVALEPEDLRTLPATQEELQERIEEAFVEADQHYWSAYTGLQGLGTEEFCQVFE